MDTIAGYVQLAMWAPNHPVSQLVIPSHSHGSTRGTPGELGPTGHAQRNASDLGVVAMWMMNQLVHGQVKVSSWLTNGLIVDNG